MTDGMLIGRGHELDLARHALSHGQGLLLTGVSGVGKSRFLAALAEVLRAAGATVLMTTASRVAAELRELEGGHPIVIVDDAHRIDLGILEALCRDCELGALSLCLAGRPLLELGREDAGRLGEITQGWVSVVGAVRLRLAPLNRDETIAFVRAAAAPHELGPFWAEKICRVSGGMPALAKIYVADAIRNDRLRLVPDLLDSGSRELPPSGVQELLRPRLRQLDAALLGVLATLGRLNGLTLERMREVVRRGDIASLAEAELIEIHADGSLHILPAVADLASSMLSAEDEDAAVSRTADILMRFAPDGPRAGVESLFLARTWLRSAADPLARYPAEQVREVVLAAARLASRAGHARQALELLTRFAGDGEHCAGEQCADEHCACKHCADAALVLMERTRANAALHEHETALALLEAAESRVQDVHQARVLLNRYRCLLIWHLGDWDAFAKVSARAGSWLPGSELWERERHQFERFRELSPRGRQPSGSVLPGYLAALPQHPGSRAFALAAGAALRVLAGADADAELLLRMAAVEASEWAAAGSPAALTASFEVRGAALLVALLQQAPAQVLETALEQLIASAVAVGSQSAQQLAFAKWLEALCALWLGDPHKARRSLESIDKPTLQERMLTLVEIEYIRALAHTGDLGEARALLDRLRPAVAASHDPWAAFELARARVSLLVASGERQRAERVARRIAQRLGSAPAAAALLLRETQTPVIPAAEPVELPGPAVAEPHRADAAAPESDHQAVITRITPSGPPDGLLSERELLVARLAASGRTNTQIASELFLSVRTVESHLHHARVKLGVTGREGLLRYFPVAATPTDLQRAQ